MRLVRTILRWLAAYILVLTIVFLVPEHIHRRDFDRAFSAWYKNRSPETEAALRAEQRKNEIIHMKDSVTIAFVLVVVGYGVYASLRWAVRMRKRAISSDTEE